MSGLADWIGRSREAVDRVERAHLLLVHELERDRQGRLDAAQPYLRRIIRLYPRSFFASYARRLVNKYEASVDRR